MEFVITDRLSLPLDEIELASTRSQGAGGQHVNKTESAVQLTLDVACCSLPDDVKQRLLARRDQRITADGRVLIKSQQHRSQERNREAAFERLRLLIAAVAEPPKPRRATRPTKASQRRRVDDKQHTGRVKALRSKPGDHG